MRSETTDFPLKNTLINNFVEHGKDIFANNKESIIDIRNQAYTKFIEQGLPTQKLEAWRNTDLTAVYNEDYDHYYTQANVIKDIDSVFQCNIPHLNTTMIALLNGWYVYKDVPLKTMADGTIIGSFAEAMKVYPDIFDKYYAKYATSKDDGFIALNTAMAQDGFFIYVPDNVQVKKPIQIVNVIDYDKNIFLQTRNLIILGKNSELTLVHCDDSYNHQKCLCNTVSEIVQDENSYLDHYKMQNVNNNSTLINSSYFYMKNNARLTTNGMSLNGGILRNNKHITIDGEGCEANVYGLYLMDKKQHIDNNVFIDHAKPNSMSNELFKGIMDDTASGVFNGHVLVQRDAQKTNAFQRNKNILLTDKAKVNSKPFLEIYADDVKCSHGATVGQLDTEAMFYIRSRGISEDSAQMLLMYAFCDEIIQKITVEPLKIRLEDMVKKRLRGELSVCAQCVLHCSHPEKEFNFEIDLSKI